MTINERKTILSAMSALRSSISEWNYYINGDYISSRNGKECAESALEFLSEIVNKKSATKKLLKMQQPKVLQLNIK